MEGYRLLFEDEAPPLHDDLHRKWTQAARVGDIESQDYTDYHSRVNEIERMVALKANQLFKKWKTTGLYGSPDQKFLEDFIKKLLRSPGAYELFCSLPVSRQEDFMKISSNLNAEMFHTYILLAEALQIKELIILEREIDLSERPNAIYPADTKQKVNLDAKAALAGDFANFKKFFKTTRSGFQSRSAISDITEDFKKFTLDVSSIGYYSSKPMAVFTMLYLLRELFGEKIIFDYYNRAQADGIVTSPVKIFYILKDWKNLKEQPLMWTMNVIDTTPEIEV